jgi:hypothetical protein
MAGTYHDDKYNGKEVIYLIIMIHFGVIFRYWLVASQWDKCHWCESPSESWDVFDNMIENIKQN